MTLEAWGWDDYWSEQLEAHGLGSSAVARVIGQDRASYALLTSSGEGTGRLVSGSGIRPLPVVGDWVVWEPGPMPSDPRTVLAVLPRKSGISRGSAGSGDSEHVLAANVDIVWIVQGLDLPLNERRLERYLAVAWESGATPEVILTKADTSEDPNQVAGQAESLAFGVPVRTVSSEDADSVDRLRATLEAGRTVTLLGPSGVGKSTLINLLAGKEVAQTGDVREDDHKGRHTTTRRELIQIRGGALLLDTPGIRELRVWELDEGLDKAFPEIEEFSRDCRFRDCKHESEPGCAVLEAVETGDLDAGRLASYRKLQAEAAYEVRKNDPRARAEAETEWKTIMKSLKLHPKYKGRR